MNKIINNLVRNKKLVFTTTTGRSGSKYLSYLLESLQGVTSVHEPNPSFHQVLRHSMRERGYIYEWFKHCKLPSIASYDTDTYIETSHMFCKGFFKPLLELGYKFDLIHLERPQRQVALSMMRLGTVPGIRKQCYDYYLNLKDKSYTLTELPGWQNMEPYQVCYWYTCEIRERSRIYEEMFKELGYTFVHISLRELNRESGVIKLLSALGIPFKNDLDKIRPKIGFKINMKKGINSTADIAPNLFEMEREVEDALVVKDSFLQLH